MTPDEQEALSRRYSDDVIILLPLSSGGIAVFNAARELCDIIERADNGWWFAHVRCLWHPPTKAPERPRPSLEDLGL